MTTSTATSTFGQSAPTRQPEPADWRAAAIAAYERAHTTSPFARQAELAGRVADLTGRPVPAERVVLADDRRALLWLDGVQFRLEGGDLVVARPCGHCGVTELVSPPLRDRADLGWALAGWEPRCDQCWDEDAPEIW